jgi:hypothetical protein
MVATILLVLVVLWRHGIATSTMLGGSIHVLLVLAAMLVIFNLGRLALGLRVL